ncbi:MAG TPA: hypothetical protein VKZ18_13410 [Polyangia bacterium]|nr:hypothetical protein [Polyangia bacterium]
MKRALTLAALFALGALATWRASALGETRAAVAWECLALISLGPAVAIVAAFAGRRLGGRWEWAGAGAALAVFVAVIAGGVKGLADLRVLEGHAGPALARAAGAVEAALKLAAEVFALCAVIALAARRRPAGGALPAPRAATEEAPPRTCDVVMKGGITSGVVYPRAVARLSESYRFVNVGGASAGAIAAGATAAAEYARANGRDGFAVLDGLPAWLGEGTRLFDLFRPQPALRAPFDVFAAFLGNLPLPFKVARAFAAALWNLPWFYLLGLAPGGVLVCYGVSSRAAALAVAGGMALTAVVVPLALLLGLALLVRWRLPGNGFGMCSGRLDGQVILSDWLAGLLDGIAGVPQVEGTPKRPLIFADLWTAGERFHDVDQMRARAAQRPKAERAINLEALTTSLSHGRPYRLPDPGRAFYFRADDLAKVLPDDVVAWMVDHAGPSKIKLPPGYHRLPEAHDLPVVFAARLSLSFPFLISAVRLWGVDWGRTANRSSHGADQPVVLDPCWMSDGGIASNFPIQFFDALVPGRPTFGLDLEPFGADRRRQEDESKNVLLPENNREGFQESWNHFQGLGGFAGALANSIQAFFDNMEARAPGFRDRIARIFLGPDEGGMNLTMPRAIIDRLGMRGLAAGDKIVARFVGERPSGWENHRWVRLRLLLGQLDPLLRDFARQMAERPMPARPPGYPWDSEAQRRLAEETVGKLVELGQLLDRAGALSLQQGSPAPLPEMRIAPRV